jgi:NitT/TauT family transport system permease protein
MKEQLIRVFSPNKTINKNTLVIMVSIQIVITIMLWLTSGPLIPKPKEISDAFLNLMANEGLIFEIGVSLKLIVKSLLYSIILSLSLAYMSVLPVFRPIGFIWSKFRFLTIVGLSFVFTIYTATGADLKIALMVFSISVFMVPGAINIVNNVTRNSLNHARTLRMREWEVVFRKQIIGTLDQMFELIKQNFAIGWMMLTMVEGLVRSEGGVGTLLLNQNKHLHLDAVFAIQISILFVGICLDYFIGLIRNLACPHANLTLERK